MDLDEIGRKAVARALAARLAADRRRESDFSAMRAALAEAHPGPPAPDPGVVFLYDEIGPWGITAEEFAAGLPASGDIELRVNSPGGSAIDGLMMYSVLSRHPGHVAVVVDGLAASIATVVMQAASPGDLTVGSHSICMIHEAWCEAAAGGADDLRERAAMLEATNRVIAGVYAGRSLRPAEGWLSAMRDETWYAGGEAVDAGLADRVAEPAREGAQVMAGYGRNAARRGRDAYGHPVGVDVKRQAYARFERARAARVARGEIVALARRERSEFAKVTFGV